MTADDALAVADFIEDLVAELAGQPLDPDARRALRLRMGEFIVPRMDWEARMWMLMRTDVLDLAAGRAVLLDDGSIWRGEDQDAGEDRES
jgi:hypothetical protein